VEETTVGLFFNRMENTVIQLTFLKFDQSQKTLEPQIKQKNPRSSEKKQTVATLFSAKIARFTKKFT